MDEMEQERIKQMERDIGRKEIKIPIEQTKPADPNAEVKAEEVNPMDEAKSILEQNKTLLAALTEERKKIEKIAANNMISGKGVVGIPPKEETPAEYAKRIMEGKI